MTKKTVELPMAQASGWYDGMVYMTETVYGNTGIPAIGYRERRSTRTTMLLVPEAEAFALALLAAVESTKTHKHAPHDLEDITQRQANRHESGQPI